MTALTYSEAFTKLEELVDELEDGNIQLDMLTEKIKEANELIAVCEAKLRTVEADVNDATTSPKK